MASTDQKNSDAAASTGPSPDVQGTGATARPATKATKAARESAGNADVTVLDDFNDKPSITAPGDGPADTTDPEERATTVGGNQLEAAREGYLTVNAAIPANTDDRGQLRGVAISYPGDDKVVDEDGFERDPKNGGRVERYPATRPNGETVMVEHNIDTGVTRIV
jgi:hypothetical protein